MSLLLVPLKPQRGLIYSLLILAEAAWLAAVTFPLAQPNVGLGAWFVALALLAALALMLGWLTDVYGLPFEFSRLVGLGLALIGILVLARLVFEAGDALGGRSWVGWFIRSLITNPNQVVNTALMSIVLGVAYIWWRCLALGYSLPETHSAALTLQTGFIGITILLLLAAFTSLPPISGGLLGLYTGAGLLAVSLAYTQTISRHHGDGSIGQLRMRLANGGLAVILVGGVALVLTSLFSFTTVQAIFEALFWLLDLLLQPIIALLIWFFILIGPYLEALLDFLRANTETLEATPQPPQGTPEPDPLQELLVEQEPAWWVEYLFWMGRILLLGLVVWLFYRLAGRFSLRRTLVAPTGNQIEVAVSPEAPGLGDLWQAGKDRLAALAGLVRRYGVGGDLRAAIAIRQIYAALLVLATKHGLERAASQTPTEFLTPLSQKWPTLAEPLALITEAYISVHYGQIPEGEAGLDAVQRAWQTVYTTIEEETSSVGAAGEESLSDRP